MKPAAPKLGEPSARVKAGRPLAVGFGLPLIMTAAVLAGAAWNRSGSGEPTVLTDREAYLYQGSDENSVAHFTLTWQQPDRAHDRWLDRDKLVALGFDCHVDPAAPEAERYYSRALPREAAIAFELGGAVWRAVGAGPRPPIGTTRLVPVDADRNAEVLEARYPDRRRYLITAAVVRPSLMKPPGVAAYLSGVISEIVPRAIHVPHELRASLPRDRTRSPHYRVAIRYGRRLEPWVTSIESTFELLGDLLLSGGPERVAADVGGISGLWYDEQSRRLLGVSDDRERPRILSFNLRLSPITVSPLNVVALDKPSDGGRTLDAEAIAPAPGGRLFISSEGEPSRGGEPAAGIFEYTREGRYVGRLAVPPAYLGDGTTNGTRGNGGFESLSVAPGGRWLFSATESSLAQDGGEADFEQGALVRLLVFDLNDLSAPPREYAYQVERVDRLAGFEEPAKGNNGVSEVLAVSDTRLLVLERMYVEFTKPSLKGANTIRIFEVTLDPAAEITGRRSLRDEPASAVLPKTLAIDLQSVTPALRPSLRSLENFEAMTFGPTLPDGRRSLVLASDDNLSERQVTAFLAFALAPP